METTGILTLPKKLRAIRKAHKMSQVKIARVMGIGPTTVEYYENARNPVSKFVLTAFKRGLQMEDVPFTDEEMVVFKKDVLYSWNNMLNIGDTDKAVELQPRMAYCVEWSYNADLQTLYELFSIKYYCVVGNKEECAKIVESLREREYTFTQEQRYWYYRYLGAIEHMQWRYKSAVTLYLKAEEIGNNFNLNDNTHYYNIGSCLANMGFYNLAIEYLEKIQAKAIDLFGIWCGVNAQKLLAMCNSKLGRTSRSLEFLEKYLEYLLSERSNDTPKIGGAYLDIGWIYQDARNYEKALEYYDIAYQYNNEEDREAYLSYLCNRALFLRSYGKINGVAECLVKGLPLAKKGTLWYEWLHALEHSLAWDKQPSIDYVEWTSIPKFHEYGCHALAMEFYALLSNHCEEDNRYKPALKYQRMSAKIYKRLIEGDFSL